MSNLFFIKLKSDKDVGNMYSGPDYPDPVSGALGLADASSRGSINQKSGRNAPTTSKGENHACKSYEKG